MRFRLQTSPFYLVEKKQDKDIARYSDKYRMYMKKHNVLIDCDTDLLCRSGLQISILSYISDGKVDMCKYIPQDLLSVK
jgi:hypothetical protein